MLLQARLVFANSARVRATLPYQILSVSLNLIISRRRSGCRIAHSSSLAAHSSSRCSYITKVESSAQGDECHNPKKVSLQVRLVFANSAMRLSGSRARSESRVGGGRIFQRVTRK